MVPITCMGGSFSSSQGVVTTILVMLVNCVTKKGLVGQGLKLEPGTMEDGKRNKSVG